MQLAFRFIVGGLLVSFFAVIGDGLKPKSFAGLFGAAPSVALATLAPFWLTAKITRPSKHGGSFGAKRSKRDLTTSDLFCHIVSR